MIATDHIRRYLLGELPPDDEAAIERAYFADPDLLAKVEEVQHDLTQDYVQGRLTTAERTRFEQRLSTTRDQREDLALAQALTASSRAALKGGPYEDVGDEGVRDGHLRGSARSLRWAIAGVVLALAVIALWPGTSPTQPTARDTSVAATTAPPSTPTSPPSIASPSPPEVSSPAIAEMRVATLVLTSDLTRDAGTPPTLTIARDITSITLVVPTESRRDRARATIASVEGRVIWTGLVERDAVHVPATLLARGDYIVSIGDDDEAQYFFRVR